MSSAGQPIDPVMALAQQQIAAQPVPGAGGTDPIAALAASQGAVPAIPQNTAVRQGRPGLGLAADIAHQVPLMDKLAAATAATFPDASPLAVHAGSWGDRYHGTLTNIHNDLDAYENDNRGGARAAKAVGVAGPMLVGAGEASPLVNALKQGVIGGLYGFSGAPDESVGGDLLDTAAGAGLGTAAAMGGHAVGSALGGAAGRVADAVSGNGQNKGQRLAAVMLLDKMRQQGVTAPDLISTLSGTNKPLTIMDVGGENSPLQRLGRTMVTLPGDASEQITGFLNQRQAGQRGRVLGDISEHLAPNTDTYGTAADLRDDRAADSHPLYQAAFANPPNPTDRLNQLQTDPDIQAGMRNGIKIQRRFAMANGQPFDPNAYGVTSFNEAGDPIIGPTPNWRTWHAGRMGLDNAIEQYRDPVTGALPRTQEVASLVALRRGLNTELQRANPAMGAADAAWATPSQQLDALNRGQTFMRADPEQITAAQASMAPESVEMHRSGAGRAMRDVANDTRDNSSIPLRLNGDQTMRDQSAAMFGQEPAHNFSNAMDAEHQMGATRRFVTGNSSTANKAADVSAANEGNIWHQVLGDIIKGGVTGGLHGALALPAINIANRTGNRFISGLVNNEPRNLELARVLTATGNDARDNINNLVLPAQARQRLVRGGAAAGRGAGAAGGVLSAPLLSALISPSANNGSQ